MPCRKDKKQQYKINHELNSRDCGYELIEYEYRKAAKNTSKRQSIKEQLEDLLDNE